MLSRTLSLYFGRHFTKMVGSIFLMGFLLITLVTYIEFFNRILTETTDSYTIEKKYQDELAYNPSYIEMYRRGNAYHGAHPCFMWYWGQRGREKVSRVIVVGADNATVPQIMGWETAGSIAEAIAMARGTMGRSAQISMMHHPPYMICDVM